MTAKEAREQIARRAGVKSGDVPVFFWPGSDKPPTLQVVRRDRLGRIGKGKSGRTERRVVVGPEWLRTKAPELWAAFVGARFIGGQDTAFIPSVLQPHSTRR